MLSTDLEEEAKRAVRVKLQERPEELLRRAIEELVTLGLAGEWQTKPSRSEVQPTDREQAGVQLPGSTEIEASGGFNGTTDVRRQSSSTKLKPGTR